MKLGTENRKQLIVAGVLAVSLLLILVLQFMPSSSTNASTSAPASAPLAALPHSATHRGATSASGKKEKVQSLDPTLQLQQLAVIEQIMYEGSERNIFVSEAETVIPTPQGNGTTDKNGNTKEADIYKVPPVPAPTPIPLKFFGFANQPGETKKIFLSKGEDVFIAGEGEIVDRRYKVVHISPTSVDIQDVVGSGPPQSIPLTQG